MTEKETVDQLIMMVKEFIHRRDWKKYHTPKNLAMSIAIEAAEIMELFQWYTNEEAIELIERDEELRQNLSEELADVMIYCLSMSFHTGIDITKAIKDKLAKNEKRFPIEVVSGKLGPYNME